MKTFLFLFSFILGTQVQAGPISSGGVPETLFQHDLAALRTILNSDLMYDLRQAGSIQMISPVEGKSDVFMLSTSKCSVYVKFIRTCARKKSGLISCNYSAEFESEQPQNSCL